MSDIAYRKRLVRKPYLKGTGLKDNTVYGVSKLQHLTENDLAFLVYSFSHLSKQEVADALNLLFNALIEALRYRKSIHIKNFGSFEYGPDKIKLQRREGKWVRIRVPEYIKIIPDGMLEAALERRSWGKRHVDQNTRFKKFSNSQDSVP